MVQGNQSYTYHHSTIGHTLAMTDQNEEIINQYAYSPFGRILGQTEAEGLEQPFKYVGQFGVQHEQNEIYYMRARYYDAETGRFLKEDPIGFDGGLNVSLYVNGNPLVGIDPIGLRCPTRECQQVLINNARSLQEAVENSEIFFNVGFSAGPRYRLGPLVVSGGAAAVVSFDSSDGFTAVREEVGINAEFGIGNVSGSASAGAALNIDTISGAVTTERNPFSVTGSVGDTSASTSEFGFGMTQTPAGGLFFDVGVRSRCP